MTGTASLNNLLVAHFAPLALEALVVTRHDFPHWMRPDLQKSLVALFAGIPGARFVGARIRDHDFDFRFSDLAEAGDGIAAGPAEYQDVDIGEAEPVRLGEPQTAGQAAPPASWESCAPGRRVARLGAGKC